MSTLRSVRSETAEMDRILAQTRADDANRTARQLKDAVLHLVIAVIEGEKAPGGPVSTLTVADASGAPLGTYQLPEVAARRVTAAIQGAVVDYLAAKGLDPALINRLAGGDADLSTSSDNHRPALRAIQGGATR